MQSLTPEAEKIYTRQANSYTNHYNIFKNKVKKVIIK